jgi:hypothetical protein
MAGTGLWKVRSGAFAGWMDGDRLYDSSGCHVGYFKGNVAYTTPGSYVGEIYRDDWIGKREGALHGEESVTCSLASITHAPYPDRAGLDIVGWSDPDF